MFELWTFLTRQVCWTLDMQTAHKCPPQAFSPQIYVTLKPTLREMPCMNLLLFFYTVLLPLYPLWQCLLGWNGDRLSAALLVAQNGPPFLCLLHMRFSSQTFTLTRLVFPPCFLSWSPPTWCVPLRFPLPPWPPPVSQNVFGLALFNSPQLCSVEWGSAGKVVKH